MEETYKPKRRFRAYVTTIIYGYKVKITLFKADQEIYDHIDLLKAFLQCNPADGTKADAEYYLKRIFTLEEIEALKEFFKNWKQMQTFDYEEVRFPISNSIMRPGDSSINGTYAVVRFNETGTYPLKFTVRGYMHF